MAVSEDTLRMQLRLRGMVGLAADDAVRRLVKAWGTAWSGLSDAWLKAATDIAVIANTTGQWPSTAHLRTLQNLRTAVDESRRALDGLTAVTNETVGRSAHTAVHDTAALDPKVIASQYPPQVQAAELANITARTSPTALDAIVARSATQIHADSIPLTDAAVEEMQRQLITGTAIGANPRQTASNLIQALQGQFNGGLNRAMVIARTETLDAYRTTASYTHAANSDILAGWIWLAYVDRRICPACLSMNGTRHPLDQPGPLDHQQGRCARMPYTKTWAELGFPGLAEPPDVVPDARAWFKGQPEEIQRDIMGPTRLRLLNSGAIGWDDLPMLRTTPAWRDSYVPRPVKDLPGYHPPTVKPVPRPPAPAGVA